ncbi:PAS domain S-box protein [Mucilaginibacter sp. AW1-3]
MPSADNVNNSLPNFLQGGGEMGGLIRSVNWTDTDLGPPQSWPTALKHSVSMMLTTKFPVLICWGKNYTQLYNDAFRPINGETKHPQAMGGSARDTYAEIWETIGPMFAGVMEGQNFGFPDFMVPLDRNGYLEDCYFDFSYSPIREEDGNIGGVLVICMETTEKVKSIQNVKESEARFRTMAESSDVMIAMSDESSNAVYFNKAWTDLTGKSMDDLLKFGWADLIHPDDKDRWLDIYLTAFKDRMPFTGEFRILSKNGNYRWLLAKGPPRFNPDGSFTGYISSCIDITDRKTYEHRMEQMLNMLPAHVVVISENDLAVEMINKANIAYWSRTKETTIGIPLLDILPELADQPFPGQLRHVLATGEVINVKESPVLFVDNDGSRRTTYVDYSYQPLTDVNGHITSVLVMSFEVTDKVEARQLLEKYAGEMQAINEELSAANEEMATTNRQLTETQDKLQEIIDDLARSEARFKYLIQEAPVAICVFQGKELVVESANDMILKIWGKSKSIIGLSLEKALPELEGQPFLKILDDVYTSGSTFYGNEIRAMLGDEGDLKEFFLNFVYQPIKNNTGQTTDILVVAIDVTEQVTARKKVERAEESLRMAIEAAGLGSFSINVIDRVFYPSPRLKEFFGFAPDEEMPYEAAINQIHPDYRQTVAELVENAIITGVRYDIEYPIIGHNDGKTRWVRGIGTVQKDDNGVNRYFTGVLHEITEQKQDEIRKNDFIGMVSHELKTPLTTLTALVQVLNSKFKNSDDAFVAGALDKASVQVKKMSTMINGFLNISRLESGKIMIDKHQFDLEKLIEEVIKETELTVSSHIIKFEPCRAVIVNADHDKIGSVISNLISNAVKYSPKGKLIEVHCEVTGNTAQVSVKDEGMGIKPQDKEKLFERYYRVESNHTQHISGFGIGLYLSAEIIKRHEGNIWVESESGIGSTFYFSLPLK